MERTNTGMNVPNPADLYDAHYFAHYCGRPYQRDQGWLSFFGSIADRIVTDIQPGTLLDAGCAKGFLVEALRDRGVAAFGVDISEYAIQNVRQDIRPYCWAGSIVTPFPQRYDLLVCIEVLEHLPRKEAEQAIENFCRHTDDILFSSSPFDYKEVTHFNVQPPEYWAEVFARHGFVRDVDFDASFITPWAFRFRRRKDPLPDVVRDYERKFWLLCKENVDLRNLVVEMRQNLAAQESKPAADFQADLDWMAAQAKQCSQWNWADRLQNIFRKLNLMGVLGGRLVLRLPSLAQPLSQTFIAEYDHLSSLTLLVESRLRPVLHPLQLTLTCASTPDVPIVEQTTSPRHLPAIGPLTLHFPPIHGSQGQRYRLTIRYLEATPGDRHAPYLWGYVRPGRPGVEVHSGCQQLYRELVMAATYGPLDSPVPDKWTPQCWNPHSLLDLGALFDLGLGILSGTQSR